jgi:succinate dehydrogenase / fumarate reductase cytochrome b subunit
MKVAIQDAHFLFRRLHSLLGLIPIGVFLIFHLWENSQARLGADHYNNKVAGWLHEMNYLTVIEVAVIALPILMHGGYGLFILHFGKNNVGTYPWQGNIRYMLQRVSGGAIVVFLLLHVGWTRIWGIWEPAIQSDLFHHMQRLLSHPMIFLLYFVGLLLCVFHLCNGLWNMAISWGLTTTVRAQNIWLVFCTLLAVLLFAMGLHGMLGFLA